MSENKNDSSNKEDGNKDKGEVSWKEKAKESKVFRVESIKGKLKSTDVSKKQTLEPTTSKAEDSDNNTTKNAETAKAKDKEPPKKQKNENAETKTKNVNKDKDTVTLKSIDTEETKSARIEIAETSKGKSGNVSKGTQGNKVKSKSSTPIASSQASSMKEKTISSPKKKQSVEGKKSKSTGSIAEKKGKSSSATSKPKKTVSGTQSKTSGSRGKSGTRKRGAKTKKSRSLLSMTSSCLGSIRSASSESLKKTKEKWKKYRGRGLANLKKRAYKAITESIGRVKGVASKSSESIKSAGKGIGRGVGKAASASLETIKKAGKGTGKGVAGGVRKVKSAASVSGRVAKSAASAGGKKVKKAASATGKKAISAASITGKKVKSAASITGKSLKSMSVKSSGSVKRNVCVPCKTKIVSCFKILNPRRWKCNIDPLGRFYKDSKSDLIRGQIKGVNVMSDRTERYAPRKKKRKRKPTCKGMCAAMKRGLVKMVGICSCRKRKRRLCGERYSQDSIIREVFMKNNKSNVRKYISPLPKADWDAMDAEPSSTPFTMYNLRAAPINP